MKSNARIRGFRSWRGFCGFFAKAATGLKVPWMRLLDDFCTAPNLNSFETANNAFEDRFILYKSLKIGISILT